MINCNKCGERKEDSDFYPRNKVCKECTKKRVSAYQKTEKGKEIHRAANKKYYQTEKGVLNRAECHGRYEINNDTKKKKLARWAVKRAVNSGILDRMPCEICGDKITHGHHPDYDRQLDVIWLCPSHHKQWHDDNGEGKNAN